jgi:hypothetical protein
MAELRAVTVAPCGGIFHHTVQLSLVFDADSLSHWRLQNCGGFIWGSARDENCEYKQVQ